MYGESERELKAKLEQIHRSGVSLFMEGHPATPASIARRCVCETEIYMADYVLDDAGSLKELRYDRVTDWK